MTVNDCKIIELPKIVDPRGNLSFVENFRHVPFEIKRTYWIYDVPGGENRGGHAFRQNFGKLMENLKREMIRVDTLVPGKEEM